MTMTTDDRPSSIASSPATDPAPAAAAPAARHRRRRERPARRSAQAVAPGSALLSPRGKVLEGGMPRFFRRLAEGVFDEDDVRAPRRTSSPTSSARRGRLTASTAPIALGFSNGANIAAAVLLLRPETRRRRRAAARHGAACRAARRGPARQAGAHPVRGRWIRSSRPTTPPGSPAFSNATAPMSTTASSPPATGSPRRT